jgi:hypothetical protein
VTRIEQRGAVAFTGAGIAAVAPPELARLCARRFGKKLQHHRASTGVVRPTERLTAPGDRLPVVHAARRRPPAPSVFFSYSGEQLFGILAINRAGSLGCKLNVLSASRARTPFGKPTGVG